MCSARQVESSLLASQRHIQELVWDIITLLRYRRTLYLGRRQGWLDIGFVSINLEHDVKGSVCGEKMTVSQADGAGLRQLKAPRCIE